MREILFRGQTRRFGEQVWMNGEKVPSNWVYGGIFQGTGDFSVIYGAGKEDFTGSDIGKHIVYTDTVCQFTGLTDKNGKRIFEGDIIQRDFGEEQLGKQNAVVYYNPKYTAFLLKPVDDWMFTTLEDCEVIGNIHDNPELLEVDE